MTRENNGLLTSLLTEIRTLYRTNPAQAPQLIEFYLQERLKDLAPEEKLELLHAAIRELEGESEAETVRREEAEFLARIYQRLLGREAPSGPPEKIFEALAQSLNTLFDQLNELVATMEKALLGDGEELLTIRALIGESVVQGEEQSLKAYLNRIKEFFLIAHQAFQEAALNKMKLVVEELDPQKLETKEGGGLKFGPLRKAELYEAFCKKFEQLKEWVDSGRYLEDLRREFEGLCQKKYQRGG